MKPVFLCLIGADNWRGLQHTKMFYWLTGFSYLNFNSRFELFHFIDQGFKPIYLNDILLPKTRIY